MPTTNIKSGQECRDLLLQGVKDIAGPVGSTLGPSGKTVITATHQQGYWLPRVTKDGATVARSINPQDPLRAAGANIAKQAAMGTAAEAGDGTTTAMILVEYLVEEGQKLVASGENPHKIKAGMETALEKVCAYLRKQSIPVSGDMVRQIATLSANGEESVGNMVAEAYSSIKDTGVVVLAYSSNNSSRVESVKGMQLACGTNPAWFNEPQKLRLVTGNSVIVVTTEMISKMADIQKIWEYCKNEGKALVIFAEAVIGEAMNTLSIPQNKANVPFCVIPLSGLQNHKDEILQDIALVTGATVLGRSVGRSLENSNNKHWGTSTMVEAYAGRSVIMGGGGDPDKVEMRCEAIRAQIVEAGSDSTERDWHESRLAGIDGGMSCIYVGANTDGEVTELYDRYEDAVRAVRCAKKEGVLPGGGATLLNTRNVFVENKKWDTESEGERLLYRSLAAPLQKICENASPIPQTYPVCFKRKWYERLWSKITGKYPIPVQITPPTLYDEIQGAITATYGYNFKTGAFCNLLERGIIDPAIVPITALQKAVSAAGSILTTDHIVTNI